jgi:hypothetical protein
LITIELTVPLVSFICTGHPVLFTQENGLVHTVIALFTFAHNTFSSVALTLLPTKNTLVHAVNHIAQAVLVK